MNQYESESIYLIYLYVLCNVFTLLCSHFGKIGKQFIKCWQAFNGKSQNHHSIFGLINGNSTKYMNSFLHFIISMMLGKIVNILNYS